MQRGRPFQRTAFLVAAGIFAPLGARAADPQPYTVAITPTGDGAIDAALKGSSSLLSLQKSAPVGPFALVTRAQGDVDRLQTALTSFGYYGGKVTMQIDGRAVDDPALPDALAAKPAGSAATSKPFKRTGLPRAAFQSL